MMGRMSDLHIQMCEDLQTDEPTNEEVQAWLEKRIEEMQGKPSPTEETDLDIRGKKPTD